METEIAVVTGGRDFDHEPCIHGALDYHHVNVRPIGLLIWGGASGVDMTAYEWADKRGVSDERFLPNWRDIHRPGAVIRKRRNGELYDVTAGHFRNQQMVDRGPTHAFIFPGGDGTHDMFKRVQKAGLAYTVVRPHPRHEPLYEFRFGFWYKSSRKKR